MSLKTMIKKTMLIIQGNVIMWRLDKLIDRFNRVTDKLNRYER